MSIDLIYQRSGELIVTRNNEYIYLRLVPDYLILDGGFGAGAGDIEQNVLHSDFPSVASLFDRSAIGLERPQPPGRAYFFNGVNNYINVNSSLGYVSAIHSYVRLNSLADDNMCFCDLNGIDYVNISDGSIEISGFSNATPSVYIDGVLGILDFPDTNWHHLYIEFDRDFEASELKLGNHDNTYFNGKVFDFRVFNRRGSQSEITSLANLKKAKNSTLSSVLHLKCDDISQTNSYDCNNFGTIKHDCTKSGVLTNFHYQGADVPWSWQEYVGYSDSINGPVPRDEYKKEFDVLGNSLEFKRRGPRDAVLIDSYCGNFSNGGYVYVGDVEATIKSFVTRVQINDLTDINYLFDFDGTNYLVIQSGNVTPFGFSGAVSSGIYIDGELTGVISDVTGLHSVAYVFDPGIVASGIEIGRVENSGYLNGKICDIRLYDYELTQADIQSLHNQIPRDPLGAVNHWKFSEGTGIYIHDVINNYDGHLYLIDDSDFWGTSFQNVYHSNVINGFDTVGLLTNSSYIDIPDASQYNITHDVMIGIWARNNSGTLEENQTLISKYNEIGDKREWSFAISSGLNIEVSVSVSGFDNNIWQSSGVIDIDNWHHYSFLASDDYLKVYLDTIEMDGSFISGSYPTGLHNNDQNILIGSVGTGQNVWDGMIHNASIYNYELTSGEMGSLYSGIGPNDFVGYWDFSFNINDRSSYQNDGAISGELNYVRVPTTTDKKSRLHNSVPTNPAGVYLSNVETKINFASQQLAPWIAHIYKGFANVSTLSRLVFNDLSGITLQSYKTVQTDPEPYISNNEILFNAAGEIKEMRLSDGTFLYMNGNSLDSTNNYNNALSINIGYDTFTVPTGYSFNDTVIALMRKKTTKDGDEYDFEIDEYATKQFISDLRVRRP
jgi:hypothetical protein